MKCFFQKIFLYIYICVCVYIFPTFFFLLLFSIGNRCQLSQKSDGRGAAAHSGPPPRFYELALTLAI